MTRLIQTEWEVEVCRPALLRSPVHKPSHSLTLPVVNPRSVDMTDRNHGKSKWEIVSNISTSRFNFHVEIDMCISGISLLYKYIYWCSHSLGAGIFVVGCIMLRMWPSSLIIAASPTYPLLTSRTRAGQPWPGHQ